MSFLASLLLFVVSSIISYVLAPEPQGPKPPLLDDFNIPSVEEGRNVGVLFGTRWITPQIIWWGNYKNEPIKADGGKK